MKTYLTPITTLQICFLLIISTQTSQAESLTLEPEMTVSVFFSNYVSSKNNTFVGNQNNNEVRCLIYFPLDDESRQKVMAGEPLHLIFDSSFSRNYFPPDKPIFEFSYLPGGIIHLHQGGFQRVASPNSQHVSFFNIVLDNSTSGEIPSPAQNISIRLPAVGNNITADSRYLGIRIQPEDFSAFQVDRRLNLDNIKLRIGQD